MADIGAVIQAILQMQKDSPAYTPPSYAPGTPTLEKVKTDEAIRQFNTKQAEDTRQFDITAGQKDQQLAIEGIKAARTGSGASTKASATLQKEVSTMMSKIQTDLSPKLDDRGRPTGYNRFYQNGVPDPKAALRYYQGQMSPEAYHYVSQEVSAQYPDDFPVDTELFGPTGHEKHSTNTQAQSSNTGTALTGGTAQTSQNSFLSGIQQLTNNWIK